MIEDLEKICGPLDPLKRQEFMTLYPSNISARTSFPGIFPPRQVGVPFTYGILVNVIMATSPGVSLPVPSPSVWGEDNYNEFLRGMNICQSLNKKK